MKPQAHSTADLTLYHMEYCPYCQRVRDAADGLGITLTMKETSLDRGAKAELVAGGGMSQVPCLKIAKPDGSVEWMYESADIIVYLRQRFG